MATRSELHQLIDDLPEDLVGPAGELLVAHQNGDQVTLQRIIASELPPATGRSTGRDGFSSFPVEPFHRMERRMESKLAAESLPAKLFASLLAFSFAVTLTILPFPVLGRPVNTIAEAAVENTLTPGVAVAILHHGSIVYEAGFGTAGPNNARVTPATRFAIGSLTKQFTAVAALQLVRQGKLSLDDRLKKFLPELPNASPITIRELLNQTSGLHNYPNPQHEWPKSGAVQSSRLIAYFAKDLSDFTPGRKWASAIRTTRFSRTSLLA